MMRHVKLATCALAMCVGVMLLAGSAGALIPQWEEASYEECLAELQTYLAGSADTPVDWLSISHAIYRLGELGNADCAPLLAQTLSRTEPLVLASPYPLPGVMCPLNMIKAASIDALKNLGAKQYIPQIQQIAVRDDDRVLRLMAREAVAELR